MANEQAPSNRRARPRRPARVDVEVLLTHEGLELTKCRLRDISSDGAFVENHNLSLVKGTDVDIVLRFRRDGKLTHCRLSAKVVRVEADGVAIMFGDLDEMTYTLLLEIVYPD